MSYHNGIPKKRILKIHKFVSQVRDKEKIGQRRLARKIKNKFNINISENTIAGWIYFNKIPFANEKTQFKPKPKPQKRILHNLYINKNISAQKIAKKFNVSTIIVINWLKSYNILVRTHKESMNTPNIKKELRSKKLFIPKTNYKALTKEKAYILGVLCGDAYLSSKIVKLEIRYDKEFIKKFVKSINKVYGTNYKYYYYKPRNSFVTNINSQIISKDLARYGNFYTFKWSVPKSILTTSKKELITQFIQGLYDSEGSVIKYYIYLTSVSFQGIKTTSILLKKIGIGHSINKVREKYYKITISRKSNLKLFKDLVNFTIKRKRDRLKKPYRLGW